MVLFSWLLGPKSTDSHVMRWDAYTSLALTVFALFSTAFSAMSGIFSFFEPVARHGWAAVVLSGIGSACVISLVLSAALVAFRYFRPFGSAAIGVLPNQAQSSDEAGKVKDKDVNAIALASEFANFEKNLHRNNRKIANFEQDIRLLRQIAIHITSMEVLSIAISRVKNIKFQTDIKSIELKDVRAEIDRIHKQIMEIGSLLEGTHWRYEAGRLEHAAQAQADELLRNTPPSDLQANVSLIDMRPLVALKFHCELISKYLDCQKLETERYYGHFLSRLRSSEEADKVNNEG